MHAHPEEQSAIRSLSTTRRAGDQTVAPFLAKHIPEQYAPLGLLGTEEKHKETNTNTKYCYRHRPDIKCRRQADEPSMEQLQRELETLSMADQQGIAHVWSLFSAAPSKLRNLMLRGILSQCCFPQLSFISASIRDLIRIDFISALPPEISFKILCYLDTTSLCKAAQVSRRWRILADDDVVWHKMCEQHIDRKCTKCGWGLPLLERKRLRASKRQIQLRASGRGLNQWSPDITPLAETAPTIVVENGPGATTGALNANGKRSSPSDEPDPLLSNKKACVETTKADTNDSYFRPRFRPWKEVYKDRFKVGTNWKYGRCSTKIFQGHTNGVMCLQFDDSILATGSYDSTIKIWDIETGKELRTLRGHESGVRCLQFDDTKLISGSIDRSLKIWNWRTGECLSTITGHSDAIITLHFDSKLLASGSADRTIKIWNFEDKSTFLLRGHTDWVNSVKVDSASRTVFSASDDCTIRLWDLDTKRCIKVFEGHVGPVQQVLPLPREFEFEDEDVECDDHDDSASNHSGCDTANESGKRSRSRSPPLCFEDSSVFHDGRPTPPRYMLTGALDNNIRLWDVSSGRCLRTFFGHVEGIWALAADTLRVVSGAQDRTVKIWDARTGKCERTFAGHAGPVTCIGLSDSRMCTGGEDSEVRLYSFRPDNAPLVSVGEPITAACTDGIAELDGPRLRVLA
ncbi:putative E3 ubiquitin ligase complex SCF subunit sconB [Xylona heveae TC161]|uniref:Putative E3 ubiquitin ligase complex SCF subunit sconB n=1 Tax=Xylona heveae (strain CBS 132557 / TC161) TaxID=1328760 RepID=A0A165G2M3_XYLHT|nr:putative E3 ubiquitin ligase complex SCF subunit sconB [Xylona heveae TC161]KZF21668.1 putative E3 ubiquitin ligase complex SCF subunit sconB [Xylona heveae TC161]